MTKSPNNRAPESENSPSQNNPNQGAETFDGGDLPSLEEGFRRYQAPEPLRKIVKQTIMRVHSGPLPPPDVFRDYGLVNPDAPRIIMEMAQRQQEHNIQLENRMIALEARYRDFGVAAGLAVVLAMILAAAYCAYIGSETVALALVGGTTLSGLARLFIWGQPFPSSRTHAGKATAAPEKPRTSSPRGQKQRRPGKS